jgi:hypothetical protein
MVLPAKRLLLLGIVLTSLVSCAAAAVAVMLLLGLQLGDSSSWGVRLQGVVGGEGTSSWGAAAAAASAGAVGECRGALSSSKGENVSCLAAGGIGRVSACAVVLSAVSVMMRGSVPCNNFGSAGERCMWKVEALPLGERLGTPNHKQS